MGPFPFTTAEWSEVFEASRAVVDATLADDPVLRASHFIGLQEVVDTLRSKYGDHPVLRETMADFLEDPADQLLEYRLAIQSAVHHNLPTLSIRLSLARLLLDNFNSPKEAAEELRACRDERQSHADVSDLRDWSVLISRCEGNDCEKTNCN